MLPAGTLGALLIKMYKVRRRVCRFQVLGTPRGLEEGGAGTGSLEVSFHQLQKTQTSSTLRDSISNAAGA